MANSANSGIFVRITPEQAAELRATRRGGVTAAYVTALQAAKSGDVMRLDVEGTGVKRATLKQRINSAAKKSGRTIKWMGTGAEVLVFEVE